MERACPQEKQGRKMSRDTERQEIGRENLQETKVLSAMIAMRYLPSFSILFNLSQVVGFLLLSMTTKIHASPLIQLTHCAYYIQ